MSEGREVQEYLRLEGILGLMAIHGGGIEPAFTVEVLSLAPRKWQDL